MSGWIDAGPLEAIEEEDLIRFDHGGASYIIARDDQGGVYAADGLCTHEHVHLSDGFVFGCVVECPRHQGRFDLSNGAPRGGPVTTGLKVYPAEVRDGRVFVRLDG